MSRFAFHPTIYFDPLVEADDVNSWNPEMSLEAFEDYLDALNEIINVRVVSHLLGRLHLRFHYRFGGHLNLVLIY